MHHDSTFDGPPLLPYIRTAGYRILMHITALHGQHCLFHGAFPPLVYTAISTSPSPAADIPQRLPDLHGVTATLLACNTLQLSVQRQQ